MFFTNEASKSSCGLMALEQITRQYMADGYDGFKALTNRHFLIDDENGQIMSSILRSFLLGSAYIFRHKQFVESHDRHLSKRTDRMLDRARREHQSPPLTGHSGWMSSRDGSLAGSPRSTMAASSMSEGGGPGGLAGRPPWACPTTHGQLSIDEALSADDRSSNKMRDDLTAQPSGAKQNSAQSSPSAPNRAPQHDDDSLSISGDSLLSPISEASGMSFASGSTQTRRHVVQHSWASIRAALYIAKHEHMSEIDRCVGWAE